MCEGAYSLRKVQLDSILGQRHERYRPTNCRAQSVVRLGLLSNLAGNRGETRKDRSSYGRLFHYAGLTEVVNVHARGAFRILERNNTAPIT